MRKRAGIYGVVLTLILCLGTGNLLAAKKPEVMVKSKMNVTKGILTITAKGKSRPETEDNLKRQYEAHSAARLVAQNEMVNKLKGYTIIEEKEVSSKYDKKQVCTMTYLVRFK